MTLQEKILELHHQTPIKKIMHLGAHIGNEIEFYKDLNPDIIYWFEPNPELISDLKHNVFKYNEIEQKVFDVAVSDKNEEIDFNLIYSDDMSNTGCSSIMELKYHSIQYPHIKKIKTVKVSAVNIDDFLIKNNLETDFDYINMDIQGSEYNVLSTSQILFNETNFRIFQIETSKAEMYEGQKLEIDVINLMSQKGYERVYYHEWSHNWGDSLFLKRKI